MREIVYYVKLFPTRSAAHGVTADRSNNNIILAIVRNTWPIRGGFGVMRGAISSRPTNSNAGWHNVKPRLKIYRQYWLANIIHVPLHRSVKLISE